MDTATKSGNRAGQDLEGVLVGGLVTRLSSRTNEHGTFWTARLEWMGGSAFVELARDEEKKLAEGQITVLRVSVRPFVSKAGRPGHSFNYGVVLA